jgi:hypothetical protein
MAGNLRIFSWETPGCMFPDQIYKELSEVVIVNKLNPVIKFKKKIELCQHKIFFKNSAFC